MPSQYYHPNHMFPRFYFLLSDPFFPHFDDYVDAVSTSRGFEQFMERVNHYGPDQPTCAVCPPPSTEHFCPAGFIFDENGNYRHETCLGRAMKDLDSFGFNDALWATCLAGGAAGIVFATKITKALRFCKPWVGIPKVFAVCVAGVLAGEAFLFWLCIEAQRVAVEAKFQAVNDAFYKQFTLHCDPEGPRPCHP